MHLSFDVNIDLLCKCHPKVLVECHVVVVLHLNGPVCFKSECVNFVGQMTHCTTFYLISLDDLTWPWCGSSGLKRPELLLLPQSCVVFACAFYCVRTCVFISAIVSVCSCVHTPLRWIIPLCR